MSVWICFSLFVLATQSFEINDHHLSDVDIEFLHSLPSVRAGARLPGFKYLYLEPGSHLTTALNLNHSQLEIAGSPRTSQHALDVAADIIVKMTRHMPPSMFQTLTKGKVGLFTAVEKMTIYPEYTHIANGNCGTSCAGNCSHTCAADGRKYESIMGLTNSRSVVLDDIVLCSAHDPYHHVDNVLVHEFGHLVHFYATTPAIKTQILSAYNASKLHATWPLNTYGMRNAHEYWATATQIFFGALHVKGGMNQCGANFCNGFQQSRDHLRSLDPAVFNILSHVYTNNNPSLNPGFSICPAGSVVVG
ncbi:hypothetical protein Bpfe_022847 [Biomphalaria pfeifferi]|uniref:Uncharacterized protein n=1 Tax=Biomphalaria pfeifferi TaxID=112525 RepID=A0AAD8B5A9_BIOPF|nr:hypothetical protein Bpfe_022847 [Biomphalaria pfeifferi]